VVARAHAASGQAYSVGITGSAGAGKSTLTDRLISVGRARGFEQPGPVAVLAIDPTSPFSGGAILGDRVRMQGHATDDGVFIRSMATKGHLGGLALAVPDAIRVLSAVGMPIVLVETVGVGQQEVAVAAATDTTVVVVNPGWGDAVQANKAGLLEIADLFVINKADRPGARETRRDLDLMLDLSAPGDWRPPIISTVAQTGEGTDELWEAIGDHRRHLLDSGRLEVLRRRRLERELRQIVTARLEARVESAAASDGGAGVNDAMAAGELDPYSAADRLLDAVWEEGPAPADER
jgi:LAO/AO transport system kinase